MKKPILKKLVTVKVEYSDYSYNSGLAVDHCFEGVID